MRSLMLAALLLGAAPAAAVIVDPGDQGFLTGTTVAARPDLAGTVIADTVSTYAITIADLGLTSSGRVQSRVVRRTDTGKLDFYWRIIPDADSQLAYSIFSVDPWTVGPVDTDYRVDGLGSVGPNRLINNSATPFAFDLNWYFAEPLPIDAESYFFFARSNATAFAQTAEYHIAVTGLGPGGSPIYVQFDDGPTYAPAVPEPGSWALMIAGFGLVGAAARWRTRATRPA